MALDVQAVDDFIQQLMRQGNAAPPPTVPSGGGRPPISFTTLPNRTGAPSAPETLPNRAGDPPRPPINLASVAPGKSAQELPAPISRLAENPGNLFVKAPPISFANPQHQAPDPREPGRPGAVRLSLMRNDAATPNENDAASVSPNLARLAGRMTAAPNSSDGRSEVEPQPSSGNPADPITKVVPRVSFTKRYADEEERGQQAINQAQTAADAVKPSILRRIGAIGIGALAGAGGGAQFGANAGRSFLNKPKTEAEAKVTRLRQSATDSLNSIKGEAGIADTESQVRDRDAQTRNLQSEVENRGGSGTEHAKLADLYADAVKKAVAEGRDPLKDSTVQQYGDAIQNLQREPSGGTRTETPFSVWRQQNPNAPVQDYFKLQPEARNETRPPKEQPRLTPGQKSTLARRYKEALSGIEQEFRDRQSGTFVDKRSGELLPPMTQDELNRRKQDAEDSYKDELEAGGETVSRYDYKAGGNQSSAAPIAPNAPSTSNRSANSGSQHKIGDEVTYKGQRYRIAGIKNGKAQLSPINANQ